jgi:hypothetical protein
MRATKAIMGMVLVLGIVAVSTANALAAEAWYTCTISRVGGYTSDTGAVNVRLTDTKGTFTNVLFKIPDNNRLNQILAVLLTAASNGATVYVKADPDAQTLKAVYYNVD